MISIQHLGLSGQGVDGGEYSAIIRLMAKKTKRTSKKTNAWFYKIRGSYLPRNGFGWFSYVPFIAYLAFSTIVGVKDVSKIWIAIIFIVANWIAAGAVMTLIAASTS